MAAATTTSATPLPSNIKITTAPETRATRYELRITSLYLHHQASPDPNATQATVVNRHGLGKIVANDFAIYDGPDTKVNAVVARAQGLHMSTGNWTSIFNLVFETGRFKGSTLQVMGVGVQDGDQWAILSGTGQFTMAQGFINKKLHTKRHDGHIIELDIYAVFQPTKMNLITGGLKGGREGQYREPTAVPDRLEVIRIRHGAGINSIEYTYQDQYGLEHTEGPWGGDGSIYLNTVTLNADEFVKEVSGTIGQLNGADVVTSVTFVTNRRPYGPFGKASGNAFTLPEKAGNGSIVGFVARTGEFVNAIGVITRP